MDSCIFIASRSLGLSRLSILAEAINDSELLAQSQWIDRRAPSDGIRLLSEATGKKRLQLLILLGSYYAFQPARKDSVEYFLTKAIDESKALKEERLGRLTLCLLCKVYVQTNDLQRGDSVFKQLMNECEVAGDKETEARALAYRGIYTPPSASTVQNKITDLQKAADIYFALNNIEGAINAVTDIGYLMVIVGQLQHAYEAFLKALQLAESIHYPYIQYNTDALVMATMFQGKFGEPLKYSLQPLKWLKAPVIV